MNLYSEIDFIHPPTDHPKWQESFVLIFRDPASETVGFLRLGAYVNEGTCQAHFGLATGDGLRFRRHRLAMAAHEGARGHDLVRAGPLSWSIPGGAYVRVVGEEAEASVDLRLYDFFPSQNWRIADPRGAEIAAKVGGFNHPESSGRVEGRVRLGDRIIDIADGLGHRDHAWGPREHAAILNNRWVAGTMGPALSFSCVTLQQGTGGFFKAAWVVRNGVTEYASEVNTLAWVLPDGLSTIGGITEITLDSGERIAIEARAIDGIITSSHLANGGPGSTPAGVEALSEARSGVLRGFCDFNVNLNALNGESPVVAPLFANADEGLTRRDPAAAHWARRLAGWA